LINWRNSPCKKYYRLKLIKFIDLRFKWEEIVNWRLNWDLLFLFYESPVHRGLHNGNGNHFSCLVWVMGQKMAHGFSFLSKEAGCQEIHLVFYLTRKIKKQFLEWIKTPFHQPLVGNNLGCVFYYVKFFYLKIY
jgi:hypothetical protein